MEILLILAVLAIVVWAVSAPLRRGGGESGAQAPESGRADLEARKEAKYREIRDAEMDWRTGKLEEADYRALDRRLRREAMDLLEALDQLDS
jgi:flagellar biosynthesis/type III secretory pathway M-ring protein FliF/YscJ